MNPREIDTARRPFVLIWELTQACELACKHCRADARPLRHPDELTTAEGKHLLEEARRFDDGQLIVLSRESIGTSSKTSRRASSVRPSRRGTVRSRRVRRRPVGTN